MVDGPHGLGTHGLGTQVSPLRPASAPPRAATPASPRTARAAPESSSTRTRTLIGVMACDTASATPVDGGVERAAAPAARESAAVAQATRRAMASVTGLCGCGCARACLAIEILGWMGRSVDGFWQHETRAKEESVWPDARASTVSESDLRAILSSASLASRPLPPVAMQRAACLRLYRASLLCVLRWLAGCHCLRRRHCHRVRAAVISV